ncbi:MAG: carbonic anhydrase family protein [Acidobacteriaceae bacterium]|nr:carbonic anhydrase family protein [Acidobacteriaceae bacterium]
MTKKDLAAHRRRTLALDGQTVKGGFCLTPRKGRKPNLGLLFVVLVPWLVSGIPMSAQVYSGPSFSYSGDTGPGFWVEISPACGTAPFARQSPVNIRRVVTDPNLGPLDLILNETSYTLTNPGYNVTARPPVDSLLTLNGRFRLIEFHFHTLTEHTVAGQYGAMELHAVFQDPNTQKLAVIGVLYKIGRANRFLAKLLTAGLPVKSNSPPVTIEKLNIGDAFTDTSSYYTYPGSLTTPGCSENVTWFVLKQWAQMSAAQFEAFHGILGNNFRPIQELNGRLIRGTIKPGNSPEEQNTPLDR